MTHCYDQMEKDWVKVFGPKNTSKLTRKTMKELSCLNPKDSRGCTAFAKRLGITSEGMDAIAELTNESSIWELADDEEPVTGVSTDLDEDTTSKPEKFPHKWDSSKLNSNLQALFGEEFRERAKVYYRFVRLERPLVTPSFFTKNSLTYKNLNILLSHVQVPVPSTVDNTGRYVGRQFENPRGQDKTRRTSQRTSYCRPYHLQCR